MIKKADILLILSLLLLSLLPLSFFAQKTDAVYAEISINGTIYKKIPLSAHHGRETIPIETADGYNLIEVDEDSISIIEADCPDGICVHTGKIKHPGETIACLPHKLLIELKGTAGKEADDDIIFAR